MNNQHCCIITTNFTAVSSFYQHVDHVISNTDIKMFTISPLIRQKMAHKHNNYISSYNHIQTTISPLHQIYLITNVVSVVLSKNSIQIPVYHMAFENLYNLNQHYRLQANLSFLIVNRINSFIFHTIYHQMFIFLPIV